MGTARGIRTPIPRLAKSSGLIRRPEPSGRPLKLVVDHESLGSSEAARELAGQAYHPCVELWTTSVAGPRFFHVRRPHSANRGSVYDFVHGDRRGQGGVQNLQTYLAPAHLLELRNFPLSLAAMERALSLYAAAESFKADAIVTHGELRMLAPVPEARVENVSVLSAEEALSLIGLRLRSTDQVAIHDPFGGCLRIDLMGCYDVLARDGLPALNGWYSRCVYAQVGRLTELGSAVVIRLRHALMARDKIQAALQFHDEPDVSSVIYHMDMLLISLAGVFDSAAHVASGACGLSISASRVGWRKERWRSALGTSAPALAAVVAPGTEGRAVLDCLAELRNLIHSEVMGSWVFRGPRGSRRSLEIPDRPQAYGPGQPVRDVVWNAAEVAGGAHFWGLERASAGDVFLAPDRFVEQLVQWSLELLDDMFSKTSFDRIAMSPIAPTAIPTPHSGRYRDEVHRTLAHLGGLAWPAVEPASPTGSN